MNLMSQTLGYVITFRGYQWRVCGVFPLEVGIENPTSSTSIKVFIICTDVGGNPGDPSWFYYLFYLP